MGASPPSAASPGRIETDGSRAAKGILARFQGFVRSRGIPAVGLGWLWKTSPLSSVSGPAPATGMSRSGIRAGFRALHGADSGPERSVRFRAAGAPQGATLRREKRRGAG